MQSCPVTPTGPQLWAQRLQLQKQPPALIRCSRGRTATTSCSGCQATSVSCCLYSLRRQIGLMSQWVARKQVCSCARVPSSQEAISRGQPCTASQQEVEKRGVPSVSAVRSNLHCGAAVAGQLHLVVQHASSHQCESQLLKHSVLTPVASVYVYLSVFTQRCAFPLYIC